jgi:hypothetical protein
MAPLQLAMSSKETERPMRLPSFRDIIRRPLISKTGTVGFSLNPKAIPMLDADRMAIEKISRPLLG